MKFSISSSDLVKGLASVSGAIPAKATLPILEMVLFEAEGQSLRLTATDLDVSVVEQLQADVEEAGSVAVPARRLLETLRQLPDIPVHFTVNEQFQVGFKTDRGTYKLAGVNGEEFPAVPLLEDSVEVDISTDALKEAIKNTVFAVSTDDMRTAMMGVYFQVGPEESRIVATDGHRLVRLIDREITAEKELKFIVPEKALSQVQKTFESGQTEVTVSEDHVRFKNDDTIIVSRLIDAQYPNYESVIPHENNRILRINKEEMLATVRRVSIFSSSTTRQIRLELSKDKVEICAEDIDMSSEARETVRCEYDEEDMVIGFNARYLADVLTHLEDEDAEFSFSTPNRAGIVRPGAGDEKREMLMLVMPVMLNTYA